MILDLRYAAGLPVNAGAIIGIGIGLYNLFFTAKASPPFFLALFQFGGWMFVGALAASIFVLPNVFAAALSNRLPSYHPWPVYALLFAIGCTLALWLQMKGLDQFFRAMGGMKIRLTDPTTIAMIGSNVALCLTAAAFTGARSHA